MVKNFSFGLFCIFFACFSIFDNSHEWIPKPGHRSMIMPVDQWSPCVVICSGQQGWWPRKKGRVDWGCGEVRWPDGHPTVWDKCKGKYKCGRSMYVFHLVLVQQIKNPVHWFPNMECMDCLNRTAVDSGKKCVFI